MKASAQLSAKCLGLSVALAVSQTAPAVHLSPDGMGQVLIYPYYTVNANNSTLISVVNTRSRAKVIDVKFLEGLNGQFVLNFRLFLSAYDVWTANVFALSATGPGNLLTDDESCTNPDIKGATGIGAAQLPAPDGRSYRPFLTGQLQTDGGPKTADRTREGHIELVDIATIAAGSPIELAITHVAGIPPGCADVTQTVQANLVDLLRPSGGIYGSGSIVNGELGTLIGYNADALDGFYLLDTSLFGGSGSIPRYLADARTTTVSAVARSYAPRTADGPNELITTTYSATNAVDAVSAIFTASAIANEYVIEASSASESEWVISMPTKSYYVNTGTNGIPPFIERFHAPGISCVKVDPVYFDREERLLARSPDFPDPLPPMSLCYQTQVLTFLGQADYVASGGISTVLGSKLTTNIDPRDIDFQSGWLRLDLNPTALNGGPNGPHALRPSVDLDVFKGLPVTGFLATNYLNRNNGGPNILSTYSVGARHRAQRDCTKSTQGGNGFCD